MQSLKIVFSCVIAAAFYGIVHDQFTARICVEYFSVFHPPVFRTESPMLLALGWGVIATWWVGAFLGVILAIAAQAGGRPKTGASELIRPILKLLLTMGVLAMFSGVAGYVLTTRGIVHPPQRVTFVLPPTRHARFMADWWAHNSSYAAGFCGGVALAIFTYRKRQKRCPPLQLTVSRD